MTSARVQRWPSTALAVLATLTAGAGVAQVARLRPPLMVEELAPAEVERLARRARWEVVNPRTLERESEQIYFNEGGGDWHRSVGEAIVVHERLRWVHHWDDTDGRTSINIRESVEAIGLRSWTRCETRVRSSRAPAD